MEGQPFQETSWWRFLVEQSRDGMVVIDQAGRVCWANEKFASMLGYSRKEIYSLTVFDWDKSIPPEILSSLLETVTADGSHFETTHLRKDGSTYDVEICSNAVTMGPEKQILCVCRDVSDRILAQKDLQRALDEARALSVKLVKQKEMLVQAEKLASIGLLAAGMAHEINNPLAYISSNLSNLTEYLDDLLLVVSRAQALADLSENGSPSEFHESVADFRNKLEEINMGFLVEDARQLLEDCSVGTKRIETIANSLRGFVRQDDPQPRQAELADIITSALALSNNELTNRCQVECQIPESLPPITCFPGQIEQILVNLLANAAQAIEGSGVVSIKVQMADEDHFKIEITDNGKGISPENITQIFDPLFTTKDVGQGTGLGLHIVRSLVERHGGSMDIVSSLGSGTTFSLVLPTEAPILA